MPRCLITSLFLLYGVFITADSAAQDYTHWPKQLQLENVLITIYGPEIESFEGNIIEGRSAFQVYDGRKLPVFGALWFRARVHIDRAAGSVFYDEIELIDLNFPDATQKQKNSFADLFNTAAPGWSFNSNLARFTEILSRQAQLAESSEKLNHEPPNVFFETSPTELIYMDGEPILSPVEQSELYEYVVNTPYFIVFSKSDQFYYISLNQNWYRAKTLFSSWSYISTPPKSIQNLLNKSNETTQQSQNERKIDPNKLNIYIETQQAVLIETFGEPEFSMIAETRLSYCTNTNNRLFRLDTTGEYFALFGGRWYKSKTLVRGAWSFVEPDQLPVDFRKIPIASPASHIRVSVPGTPEAMSVALDNAIPQTAVVDRRTARMQPEFDGEPEFKAIEGTSLAFAINSNSSILKTGDGTCYAVDEGIWFKSDSPTGIWKASHEIPAEVDLIPPTSPVYNLKFVYIYDASEDYVYVGYSGGYTGSFLYKGVLVYGTGYRYKPWYKNKFYTRPMTYSFGVNSKPWKSNVRVSVGVGYGYGYGYPGYYGPYGYWGGYGMGYGNYGYASLSGNSTLKIGYERKPFDPVNIYNNRVQGIVATETVHRNDPFEPVASGKDELDGYRGYRRPPSNLYADTNGQIYKEEEDGWYLRSDGVWEKVREKPKN